MMVDIQRAVEAQGLWPSGGSVSVGSGAEFAHQAQPLLQFTTGLRSSFGLRSFVLRSCSHLLICTRGFRIFSTNL